MNEEADDSQQPFLAKHEVDSEYQAGTKPEFRSWILVLALAVTSLIAGVLLGRLSNALLLAQGRPEELGE